MTKDRRKSKLELLLRISKELHYGKNLDQLAQLTIEGVTRATNAVTSTLYTVARDGKIDFKYIYGAKPETEKKLRTIRLKPGQGIVGNVIQSGRTYLSLHAQKDPRLFKNIDEMTGFETRSIVCVPLKRKEGKVIGAIQIINKKNNECFTKKDVSLLEDIADLAAIAFEQEIGRQREIEINIAKEYQKALLPKEVPLIEGTELAVSYTPAKDLSGDFYDFISLDKARLSMIIADVAGKNYQAAMHTNLLRTNFRQAMTSKNKKKLKKIVSELNDIAITGNCVATALCMIYDSQNKYMDCCDAGHGYYILSKSKKRGPKGGLILGVAKARYPQRRLALNEGDTLLFYTDGLIDAKDPSGRLFSRSNIEKLIAANSDWDAQTILGIINSSLEEHAAGAEQNDDCTIIVFKIDGKQERLKKRIAAEYAKRPYLTYHNWPHSLYVLREAARLAQGTRANPKILYAAALLHDIGYFYSDEENHEVVGATRASDFLSEFTKGEIEKIQVCIKTTNYMVKPRTIEAKIIKDADNSQFAQPGYFERLKALVDELSARGRKVSFKQVAHNTYDFMTKWLHLDKNGIGGAFYTSKARDTYGDQLIKNLEKAKEFKA